MAVLILAKEMFIKSEVKVRFIVRETRQCVYEEELLGEGWLGDWVGGLGETS